MTRSNIMASSVYVDKVRENDEEVVYRFGPSDSQNGELLLNKKTGEIKQLVPVSVGNSGFYYQRAAMKILRHHQAKEYPEKTQYAS